MALPPNEAYTSVRPDRGEWTASFGVSNHFANLKGEQIRIYSACQVALHDYNVTSGHAGKSGQIVFQIRLSEPITGAVWQIGPHGKNLAAPARLGARCSRDGQNWLDAHVYPAGQGSDYSPPPVKLENAPLLKSVTSMVGTPQLMKSRLTVSGRPLYLRSDASDVERLKQQIREAHWDNKK